MAYCSSYYLYQRYEMRGGQEAIPSYPNVYSIDGEGSMPLRTRAMYDEDCGYMPDVQTIYRWNKAPSTEYECVGFDKHYVEYYQYSNDGGITWANVEPVSSRTSSSVIEYNSQACDYVPPTPQPEYRWTVITPTTDPSTYWCDDCPYGAMYRWNKAPVSDYECVGNDKHYKEYYQVSYDGGETWSNVVPTTSRTSSDVIEYNSQACGGSTPTGYKFLGYYEHESPYELPCDSSSTLDYREVKQNPPREILELTNAAIGNCITTIGQAAFSGMYALSSVTIPNSVTAINWSAFQDCYSLTSVTIPNSVTSIGNGAFKDCLNLFSVTIGTGVTSIDNYAFDGCLGLQSITVNAATPPTLGYGVFSTANSCPIYVPCNSVNAYKTANRWSNYADRIHGISPCTEYRTTSGTPYCNYTNHNKYVDVYSQISYDGGRNWTTTATTQEVYEYRSQECGYVPTSRDEYLTFVAIDTGTFKLSGNSISYSLDSGTTWTNLASNTNSPTVSAGSKIMWKKTFSSSSGTFGVGRFSSTGRFTVEGNIMSIVYGDNFVDQTSLSGKNYAFRYLFSGCTGITSVENLVLPATTLSTYCYSSMFYGCDGLTSVPSDFLPATTLADHCYYYMFSNCAELRTLPLLPATSLATFCYGEMFNSCFSITSVPSNYLSASTMANSCYGGMFNGCTGLTTMPTLSATTLADGCYQSMFASCYSLTTVSVLPATTLANWCYSGMFQYCTSLRTVPSNMLPATTMTQLCYNWMFKGCSSLTSVPNLPATTLAVDCYSQMFESCTSLTSLPSGYLPASTLAEKCYLRMFYGCTSLVTAPALTASTLVNQCYSNMFAGCSSLNYVVCLATETSPSSLYFSNCCANWMSNVSSTGTFVKSSSAYQWDRNSNGIPSNWSVTNV